MQALFSLTIAYRFGDAAVRLLDLEDSSPHDRGRIPGCDCGGTVVSACALHENR
jgi:hypothetical protein